MSDNAYDLLAYPTTVIPATHPDRMATTARLHGLTPPPIETARVLELGGGDALNAIALAVAYPRARFVSIDLAAEPVKRGIALAGMLRIDNVEIRVGDIVAEAETLAGPFDYVIAHGVYAWVPEAVREAIMRLIGRVLAPNGVAYISYNALPGGHFRLALRDILLHHLDGVHDPRERVALARQFLEDYGTPREPDAAGAPALREEARNLCRKSPDVLAHDELGDWFEPQALRDVVGLANAHGLSFLNDEQAILLELGLQIDDADRPQDEASIVRRAQTLDYETMRFFSHTLFVRTEAQPARRLDPAVVHDLWMTTKAERVSATGFRLPSGQFDVGDEALADVIVAAAACRPAYLPIAAHLASTDHEALAALVSLYAAGAIMLHSAAAVAAADTADRPVASRLARALIASGQQTVVTLDHQMLLLEDPGARAFLMLMDGTRDGAALQRDWAATPYATEIDAAEAQRTLARFALIAR